MSYPNAYPEATNHQSGIVSLLSAITYLLPENNGGGIHAVRDPKQAILFKGYTPPAVIVTPTGSSLETSKSQEQGGILFEEWMQFDITTINASFDLEGLGATEGQVDGDPGANILITDIRLALYGKIFSAPSPWQGGAMRSVKVYPVNPPFTLWAVGGSPATDENRIYYRMHVKTSWAIVA